MSDGDWLLEGVGDRAKCRVSEVSLATTLLSGVPDDLSDPKPSPRNESLVAGAVQWADRIMRKIDNVFER